MQKTIFFLVNYIFLMVSDAIYLKVSNKDLFCFEMKIFVTTNYLKVLVPISPFPL